MHKFFVMSIGVVAGARLAAAAADAAPIPVESVHPNLWPSAHVAIDTYPVVEHLLAQLTLGESGQMIQADIASITPE
jgi:hypothetical protein